MVIKSVKHCLYLLIILMMARSAVSLSSRVVNQQTPAAGIIFHWFRGTDLRLHDNPALDRSASICAKTQSSLVPVFCFDPRYFGDDARSEFGSLKCGPKRAKFVLESVMDLRKSLQQQGSDLLVACARPEDFFVLLESAVNGRRTKVVYQDEVCTEERGIEFKVNKVFGSKEKVWGSTLYELDELPYDDDLGDLPDSFTPFRNQVEKKCTIHNPLQVPKQMPFPAIDDLELFKKHALYSPSLEDLGYTKEQVDFANEVDPRGVMPFIGGETAALARVKDYIWDKDLLSKYFDTRNGMIGADYSTKFAPWLAHGCLSPRYVAKECKKYEEQRVANKSTYWVVFEMLWRDYFKLFAFKHGSSMFFPGGIVDSSKPWKHYPKNLQAWIEGKTGFPLVDANMRELAATGFMSNRGRQNVASFLALELNQDWRYGADYFESVLLDYDVHSNWGNWCAAAGMTGKTIVLECTFQSCLWPSASDFCSLSLTKLFDRGTFEQVQYCQTEQGLRSAR
jgi:deoxyribodipyrimidine photo-lyase